jgi:hypothetical protein
MESLGVAWRGSLKIFEHGILALFVAMVIYFWSVSRKMSWRHLQRYQVIWRRSRQALDASRLSTNPFENTNGHATTFSNSHPRTPRCRPAMPTIDTRRHRCQLSPSPPPCKVRAMTNAHVNLVQNSLPEQ